MVDAAVLARKVAAIRDAVGRIREVLPETPQAFLADRNLVAHHYGVLDFTRVHAVARAELDDLLTFCDELAARVRG